MSKLAIALPLSFGIMALGVTIGLDFYKKQALFEGPEYTISQYITDATGSFKAQAKEVAANRSLTDYLGEAPEGWTKREFTPKDMELLTGAPLPDPQDQIPGLDGSGQAVLALVNASVTRGTQKGGHTYEKDGTLVIVEGSFLPARVIKGVGGKQLGMMADIMNLANMGTDFAIVRGLKFEEPPAQGKPKPYRRFTASLGQQIRLSVLSNADNDDDVMEIMGTFNIAEMNQMLIKPIPKMGENDILLLASTEEGQGNQSKAKSAAFLALAAEIEAAEIEAADEQAAAAVEQANALVEGDTAASLSFADRLSALLGTGKSGDDVKKPRRMVCKMQQGFKRCSFPKDE